MTKNRRLAFSAVGLFAIEAPRGGWVNPDTAR
jgi:hypothetical protein